MRRRPRSRQRATACCSWIFGIILEKCLLGIAWIQGWRWGADFRVGGGHGDAAARGALDEALHDEEGLVNFLEGGGIFTDGDGEGVEADGAAAEFVDHGFEESLVHFIEAVGIDLDHGEG